MSAATEHAEHLATVKELLEGARSWAVQDTEHLAALTHIESVLTRHAPTRQIENVYDAVSPIRCLAHPTTWLRQCPERRDAITHLEALR